MTQNTHFGNQMTQNTLFYGFHVDGQKNLKALGEHDPGSAQDIKMGEHQAKCRVLPIT